MAIDINQRLATFVPNEFGLLVSPGDLQRAPADAADQTAIVPHSAELPEDVAVELSPIEVSSAAVAAPQISTEDINALVSFFSGNEKQRAKALRDPTDLIEITGRISALIRTGTLVSENFSEDLSSYTADRLTLVACKPDTIATLIDRAVPQLLQLFPELTTEKAQKDVANEILKRVSRDEVIPSMFPLGPASTALALGILKKDLSLSAYSYGVLMDTALRDPTADDVQQFVASPSLHSGDVDFRLAFTSRLPTLAPHLRQRPNGYYELAQFLRLEKDNPFDPAGAICGFAPSTTEEFRGLAAAAFRCYDIDGTFLLDTNRLANMLHGFRPRDTSAFIREELRRALGQIVAAPDEISTFNENQLLAVSSEIGNAFAEPNEQPGIFVSQATTALALIAETLHTKLGYTTSGALGRFFRLYSETPSPEIRLKMLSEFMKNETTAQMMGTPEGRALLFSEEFGAKIIDDLATALGVELPYHDPVVGSRPLRQEFTLLIDEVFKQVIPAPNDIIASAQGVVLNLNYAL